MIISEKDKNDTIRVGEIIKKINNIDAGYANSELDIIFQQQPFLISLILGYKIDLKAEEQEEMIKIIFIIWEYFKHSKVVNRIKISQSIFEKIQLRNTHLLKYLEGAPGQEEKSKVVASDLAHLNSKALLSGLFLRFNTQIDLNTMNAETKGILMLGMKSLVECFEEIEKNRK